MSIHDYQISRKICELDPPFYALIMAAMQRADTTNQQALSQAFPTVWSELIERHHSPGGLLKGEVGPT
jgi:hypothetical protein